MKNPKDGCLLRIFIGENDKFDGKPLYEWIVYQAREQGLCGATVLRGTMGYGVRSRIHTSKILRLSRDLPVVVEMIDARKRLEDFLSKIDHVFTGGLATFEKVDVRFYKPKDAV